MNQSVDRHWGLFFGFSSARYPALHHNRRCPCGTAHGPAMVGYSSGLERSATVDEFRAYGAHHRAAEAVTPRQGKKGRLKAARLNGPRGKVDRGSVFQALGRCNYPGRITLERPMRRGAFG